MKIKVLSTKDKLKYKKLYLKMQNRKGFIENYANEEQNYKNLDENDLKQLKKLLIKK